MGHLYHGYVSHNQRVNLHFPMVFLWFSYGFPIVFLLKTERCRTQCSAQLLVSANVRLPCNASLTPG